MKPLVYYCRWQGATLRLRGRDETAVWGHLVFADRQGEEAEQPFKFNLKTWQLTMTEPDGKRIIQLDEMGTTVS